ncbi:MAG: rhamnan synthesis F family protein [Halioglobus sp.]|nr:rhamnan synthesis F family protein [Halioglobus sp.]
MISQEALADFLSRTVVVIHGFYVREALAIIDLIDAVDLTLGCVLVTTDTEEKQRSITSRLSRNAPQQSSVVLCPNRGRDIGPFLIEGGRVIEDYEFILHLHTKRSPHNDLHKDWSRYLWNSLLGNRRRLSTLAAAFQSPVLGLVYPEHHPTVAGLRNWGFDFHKTRSLLNRMGIEITAEELLEFPTGSMFWSRIDALHPLFAVGLEYADFEPESGQVDGTLAHAIERSLLYIVESSGYSFAKLEAPCATASEDDSIDDMFDGKQIARTLRSSIRLLGSRASGSEFRRRIDEVDPVDVRFGDVTTKRFNVLIPTLKPEKTFGGIASALRVAAELFQELPAGTLCRLIVTSDDVDRSSVNEAIQALGVDFSLVRPSEDIEANTVVTLKGSADWEPLCISTNDLWFATAWWTAHLGFRLLARQREVGGLAGSLVYLIQDFEPGFYNWSDKYALAESTYHHPESTVAIINSEELANFFAERYKFRHASVLPYSVNDRIADAMSSQSITERRKQVLVLWSTGGRSECLCQCRRGAASVAGEKPGLRIGIPRGVRW